MAIGGRVTSAIACNGNSSYGTLNGVGVTYCYSTFLFFLLLLCHPIDNVGWHIAFPPFLCYYYGTLNGVWVTYCYSTFLFFLLFFFHFFCPAYILELDEPNVMELYHNVNQHVQICNRGMAFSRCPPLPWKRNKCEK